MQNGGERCQEGCKRLVQLRFETYPAKLFYRIEEGGEIKSTSTSMNLIRVVDRGNQRDFWCLQLYASEVPEDVERGNREERNTRYMENLMLDVIFPVDVGFITQTSCEEPGCCICTTELRVRISWDLKRWEEEKGLIHSMELKYTNSTTRYGRNGKENHKCRGTIHRKKSGEEVYISRNFLDFRANSGTPSMSKIVSKDYFKKGFVLYYKHSNADENSEPFECYRHL